MSAPSRGRRAAHCADRMQAKKPGERTGSRPKPPEAGARSASLEPGRAPGYRRTSQLLHRASRGSPPPPLRGKGRIASGDGRGLLFLPRVAGEGTMRSMVEGASAASGPQILATNSDKRQEFLLENRKAVLPCADGWLKPRDARRRKGREENFLFLSNSQAVRRRGHGVCRLAWRRGFGGCSIPVFWRLR